MSKPTFDCCSQPGLLPIPSAMEQMYRNVSRQQITQLLPLLEAVDFILAENIEAPIAVPAYDNSAMDGYALALEDGRTEYQLKGTALAGHPYSGELHSGDAVRIMTGAPVPSGATAVVMQENVVVAQNCVQLQSAVRPAENIRKAGEDIQKGQIVLAAGQILSGIDIGLLASLGIAQVRVFKPLRVALFSTGDELVPPGESLASGQIYDSNRYALIGLLKRLPVEIYDLGLIADNAEDIRRAFTLAAEQADVIISSGGVSVGDADFTKEVLDDIGEIMFWKIAMKPGKPFAFGRLGEAFFFGLPGNPVSAVVTYHQLVAPILLFMAGASPAKQLTLSATSLNRLKKQPGRTDFQRGIYETINGKLQVSTTGLQSSGALTSMSKANCFIVLEAERGSVAEQESVTIMPFDRLLN